MRHTQIAHAALTVVLAVGLIVFVMLGRKTRLALQQELRIVTDANSVLREALGNMTNEIADKDKQIDSLLESRCPAPEEGPGRRQAPRFRQPERAKPPDANSIRAD